MYKKKHSFFAKTLMVSLTMLILLSLIVYLLFYFLMPAFYRRYKVKEFDKYGLELCEQLATAKDDVEEIYILNAFARQKHTNYTIRRPNGSVFYEVSDNVGVSITQDIAVSEDVELTISRENLESDDRFISEFKYCNSQGEERTLSLEVPLQPINEAKTVLIQILPIVGISCILLSFLLAVLFSQIVVRPIRRVQKTVREMAELKPEARISDQDGGAFAEMSQDINSMYEELRNTILDLEKQLQISSDAENEKIAFLRSVSHELKTPLASANALIEGITCGVEPYCNEQEKYLEQCHQLLEKAITLTRESLSLAPVYHEEQKRINLHKIVEQEFRQYKVILRSRQIHYELEIPDDVFLTTSSNLFSKVLSNVFSNAANYTDPEGAVSIHYEKGKLRIDNSCTPLSKEELETVMKPMQTGKKRHENSNGLGLFIVAQSLTLLKIPFIFAPLPDGKGMRFELTIL